jgi:low affinity Fe/Cu permease
MTTHDAQAPEDARKPEDDKDVSFGRKLYRMFDTFAGKVTQSAGSPVAFSMAFLVVIVWAISGPLFGFSEVWQLVINTGTTIVTFLMVFLIQQSQNKDSAAVHLKLNELLASHSKANNRLICIEDLDEKELLKLTEFYRRLGELAEDEAPVSETHSLLRAKSMAQAKRNVRDQANAIPAEAL